MEAFMKIAEKLKDHMTVSFEVFPPKEADGLPKLETEVNMVKQYNPDFISCTYGAGGTNVGMNMDVCDYIQNTAKIDAMTHFTCIGKKAGSPAEDLERIDREVKQYREKHLDNILALRGDFQKDPVTGDTMTQTNGKYNYASELIAHIHATHPEMCIACAGDPEVHPNARSPEADIAFMRLKQDAGASFIMCQTCHDVVAFDKWAAKIRHAGVHIPLVLGVMPVLNCRTNGGGPNIQALTMNPNESAIPRSLAAIIGKYTAPKGASDELAKKYADDFKKAGKEWTVDQIYRLMNCDLQGVHLYTLNKAKDACDIVEWSGLRPSPSGENHVHAVPCVNMGRF
jgi:methylenetetrahydrofolate reductase (NADPH)